MMCDESCRQNDSRDGRFWSYVLPSMVSMLLAGFYSIVDGFFIGRVMGDVGLSGVNIAWPITSFLMALGTGIGVGGGVAFSHRMGMGKEAEAGRARGNAMLILLAAALVMTAVLILCLKPILSFLGAEGDILHAAMEYGRVIAFGAGVQIFGCGMVPLLRNAGKTSGAMFIMVTGLLTNIVLDAYLILILKWGMMGAALATTIAQAIVAVLCLIVLYKSQKGSWRRTDFLPDRRLMVQIGAIGFSPFGLTYAPSIIIIFTNWQCIRYGGAAALSAYTVLSYVMDTVQLSLQGIGDGIQPLISYYNGAGRQAAMKRVREKAFALTFILSMVCLIAVILLRNQLPPLFGVSSQAALQVSRYVWLFALAFPLTGIVRLASAYFYAVQKNGYSTLLIYLDPLCLTPILLFALPKIMGGLTGVWTATPAAQGILAVLALFLFAHYRRRITHLERSEME